MYTSFHQQNFGATILNTSSARKIKFYMDKQYYEGFPTPNYDAMRRAINEFLPSKKTTIIFDKADKNSSNGDINIIGEIQHANNVDVFCANTNINDRPEKMKSDIIQAIQNALRKKKTIK